LIGVAEWRRQVPISEREERIGDLTKIIGEKTRKNVYLITGELK